MGRRLDEDESNDGEYADLLPTVDDTEIVIANQTDSTEAHDCSNFWIGQCPMCGDGIQNGDEEDIDCGGEWCDPCPTEELPAPVYSWNEDLPVDECVFCPQHEPTCHHHCETCEVVHRSCFNCAMAYCHSTSEL